MGASLWVSPSSCAADLQTIQHRGKLIVAVKDNLRPLGFQASGGQLQGLEIEIAQQLAQELLGHPDAVVLKPVLNQERLKAVLNGQVDIAIAKVTSTRSRARIVSFSIPYYLDGTAIVTKDPSLQRTTDLTNQPIAVLENADTIDVLRYRLPAANLIGVESYEAARALLESGEATAFAGDASVLTGWIQEFPEYRLLTPTLSADPLCIVLPKGLQYDALRRRINEILLRWKSEGWLQERIQYWGLP